MNTSISKNIKRLRQKAGLTREQVAEKLFVTRQTVSLWENGRTQPDIGTPEPIAAVFGVDLTCVLYGASVSRQISVWGYCVSFQFFSKKVLTNGKGSAMISPRLVTANRFLKT